MPNITHPIMRSSEQITGARSGTPRRSLSIRWDNVFGRRNRPLVTGASPDHPAYASHVAGAPVLVTPPPAALPFAIRTAPRARIGTVPKLAPGNQGSGLGQPVGAGFQSLANYGFTPLESSPPMQGNFRAIRVPNENVVPWMAGKQIEASYQAHDFAPASRFFNQARQAPMWAQSNFPPQQRLLIPPVNQRLVRNPSNVVRKMVPAGQNNPSIYTIGYPTRVGVAAQLSGGPVSVLGGGY